MARLENPVHRDDAAVLFGMVKTLTASRSKLTVNDVVENRKVLAKLNTLILVIGVYFGQGGVSLLKHVAK